MSEREQHGFHVLKLSGSDAEMGFQHGQALKAAIQRGVIPYFKDYLPRTLQPVLGVQGARAAQALLYQTTGKQLFAAFPAHIREHIAALAAGADVPLRDVVQAFVLPDLFLWLVSRSNRAQNLGLAPQLGCSTVFAQGTATHDGSLLHGRNLDYMGVGHWDAEAAILFYKPDQGLPYVSVSSAGVPLGGITAMNSAGLTLAVHQHLSCLNVQTGGTPIGAAGDQVMRQAQSLAEAVKILDKLRPNACWTYLIASSDEKALLCYEATGTQSEWFITQAEQFAYTNFYLNPELAQRETHLYPSQWRSNLGRYKVIQAQLASHQGQTDANQIAAILGQRGAGTCRLSHPLAMLLTVSSVVFVPGQQLLYAASGPAPTSQRAYWAFDLQRQSARLDLPPLQGGLAEPQQDQGFTAYRQAYQAWFSQRDSQLALKHLETASRLQPREALYAFMAGLVALDAALPDQAVHWLQQALNTGHTSPERQASFHLWRGRALDVVGLRQRARQDYQQVLAGGADAKVRVAAQKGLQRPWRLRRLALEFNYADLMQP